MPCICQLFNKNKRKSDNNSGSYGSTSIESDGQVSASQVVQLRAEVWSLRKSASDSDAIRSSMQEALTKAAAEKYDLLEELNRTKSEIMVRESLHREERNVYCRDKDKFLQEIAGYRTKIKEMSFLVDKISNQNIEFKKSLLEANDVISKLERKCMRMKYSKMKAEHDTA
ncbi:uncharacterized protein LOC129766845 [Toxorhynchites rutilus septentrionalis]|uniref:uncharacterized protein LOC129766845 n=1 Tax=Toxorhynchites rutilus septentrionalis TaxID=329112 RepID=UPI00247AF221|nr:uncharacterized protein LOC129766845 [Toxorhynchites rutilus septentrionalis]